MRRAVLLILAQAHALRLARPPALKPKRLAKAATLTTAALAGGARKAWASGVEAAAGAAAAEALAGETAAELAETALTAASRAARSRSTVARVNFAMPSSRDFSALSAASCLSICCCSAVLRSTSKMGGARRR